VDGQPDGRHIRRGPIDSVPASCCNIDAIASLQSSGFAFVFKAEYGFPADQHHPLRCGLLVPECWRAALPRRNNPFHHDTGFAEQLGKLFFSAIGGRKIGEKIAEHGGDLSVNRQCIEPTLDFLLHGLEGGALVVSEAVSEFCTVQRFRQIGDRWQQLCIDEAISYGRE